MSEAKTEDRPAPNLTLYQITLEMQRINRLLEEAGGDLSKLDEANQAAVEYLSSAEPAKIDKYIDNIRQLEMEEERASAEAINWTTRSHSRRNAIAWYKNVLFNHLAATGQQEAVSEKGCRVSITSNGGNPPIEYADGTVEEIVRLMTPEEMEEYVRYVPVIQRSLVMAALKDGRQLSFAKLGERGKHLRIS